MLQSVLTGKEAEVYSALGESSWEFILWTRQVSYFKGIKPYELVPEAYKQKFRKYKKNW